MASNDTTGSTHSTTLGGDSGGTRGTTTIADTVVATIAGIAVRETDGVYAVGGSASRAIGSVRDRVSKTPTPSRGIKVEVGETQAAIDVDVIVEYGEPIADAAKEIRNRVTDAVETMTGLEVVEINIKVSDVHLAGPDDDEDEDSEPSGRVR
ncbi:Asp23/Gls24 family envelope stress response protein [Streptomyces sp. NPDC090052]|uniref:Asp23/Gls24 family envelope stress response protein n=1 Tax=unclassified Streptomyces TaxID=2593676 RepID=UPI00225A7914|nr:MULTISPECIES: Asp23/Gls24 family envelope stress response protein [unclassified Streptomyces]MCX4726310.1 Asp23/Gls24 family envelope stress response protein [Streptomyces sp. NBC_01306]WSV04356.1 Asp23/Gls24 family envelope stress response protein [Streptomyces sp. NBC_01020]WSX42427.1 Asp23/Gls24 family envelope stress response protein [Streptomyces sp. NBC_00963]WSX69531.1 Asp23/Gls24 family envelope stress response protein [Streptomyces sp. NBC_00932]